MEESTCTALDLPVKVSTVSHHVNVLRHSGIVSTRLDGTARPSRLRRDDLERRPLDRPAPSRLANGPV